MSRQKRCPPGCECGACLRAKFDLYYAKREASRAAEGIASPKELGRRQARLELAERRARPRR